MKRHRPLEVAFERQEEYGGTQVERVWRDTAVVTARLWIQGTGPDGPFGRRLRFSDT